MRQFSLFKLHFPNGLHIGSGGFGDESTDTVISSDTLFSALCSTTNLLYGSNAVEQLLLTDAVRISSTFPFFKDELFFPKPLNALPPKSATRTAEKKFNKVKYVAKEYFESYLRGEDGKIETINDCILQSCLRTKQNDKDDKIYSIAEVPRVTLDRISNSSSIFYFSEVQFSKEAGLYFLASFTNDDIKTQFTAALRLLGEEGIGADRTVGKGMFSIENDIEGGNTFEIDVNEKSQSFVLLSLYSPAKDEISSLLNDGCSYNLVTRRGWVTSPGGMALRRQSLKMFAEGSVITLDGNIQPAGKNNVVLKNSEFPQLPFDIYRYGRAFALPITVNFYNH